MIFRLKLIIFLLLLFILQSTAYPHSGRTDAQGGHTDRKTGEYHYHSKPESKPTSKSLQAQQTVTVVRIVDGDTLKVRYWGKEESIRLIGIEIHQRVELIRRLKGMLREADRI